MFRNSISDEINITEEIVRLPVADIQETENSVIAAFELPGVSKENIELNITEDRIEVKVKRKLEKKAEEKQEIKKKIEIR